MLIYHPAYDAYHCVFRMLVVINAVQFLETDKARLLDFYLIFPSAISKIRLPQNLASGRKIAKDLKNSYRDPINSVSSFRELHQIQLAALKCIAASGLIDINKFSKGIIERTEQPIPEFLLLQIKNFIVTQGDIAKFILNDLSALPLNGPDGLKHRTELLEYRYDLT